jgi:hypothetical protein
MDGWVINFEFLRVIIEHSYIYSVAHPIFTFSAFPLLSFCGEESFVIHLESLILVTRR